MLRFKSFGKLVRVHSFGRGLQAHPGEPLTLSRVDGPLGLVHLGLHPFNMLCKFNAAVLALEL